MHSSSPTAADQALDPPSGAPFTEALALAPLGTGAYRAELGYRWTVGGGRIHGGLLLALVTRAGMTGLAEKAGDGVPSDPVAVSAEYLRAPVDGPVELTTEVTKVGRTVAVTRVELRQADKLILTSTVTAGRLSDEVPAQWTDLPALAAEPPAGALGTSDVPGRVAPMAHAAEVRLDPTTVAFLRGEQGEPTVRGWIRPHGEPPNALFAVMAGDVLPPVVFNLIRPGWSPTVQMTVLLRGNPAPGWLRLEASSRVVGGGWFDEDCTVIDSTGRLVVQCRQLALFPLKPD